MDERLGTDVLLYSRIISLYGLEILVEFSDISRLTFDLTNISAKDAVFWYNLDSAKIQTYFEFWRHFYRATAGHENGAKIQIKTRICQNPNCT